MENREAPNHFDQHEIVDFTTIVYISIEITGIGWVIKRILVVDQKIHFSGLILERCVILMDYVLL